MIIHNQMRFVVCAVALAVVFLGAGCGRGKEQRAAGQPSTNSGSAGSGDQMTPDGSGSVSDGGGASVGGDVALPTRWAEYRSTALGVTVPYPEGWWVEENAEGDGVDFFEVQPPAYSDMPPRVWAEASTKSLDQLRSEFPGIYEEAPVERPSGSFTRIVHPRVEDPATDELRRVAYIQVMNGRTVVVDGIDGDPVLEHMVDALVSTGGAQ